MDYLPFPKLTVTQTIREYTTQLNKTKKDHSKFLELYGQHICEDSRSSRSWYLWLKNLRLCRQQLYSYRAWLKSWEPTLLDIYIHSSCCHSGSSNISLNESQLVGAVLFLLLFCVFWLYHVLLCVWGPAVCDLSLLWFPVLCNQVVTDPL